MFVLFMKITTKESVLLTSKIGSLASVVGIRHVSGLYLGGSGKTIQEKYD